MKIIFIGIPKAGSEGEGVDWYVDLSSSEGLRGNLESRALPQARAKKLRFTPKSNHK